MKNQRQSKRLKWSLWERRILYGSKKTKSWISTGVWWKFGNTDSGELSISEIQRNAIFYGHPQNRFWKVLAQVLNETVPQTIPEKKEMLLRHHIALWDVIASCDIAGSSDSSIRNVVPNDLAYIIGRSRITRIYANGAKSKQLYDKYLAKQLGIEAVQLPSTSPANAAYSVERLLEYWQKIIKTPEKERQSMLAYTEEKKYTKISCISKECARG